MTAQRRPAHRMRLLALGAAVAAAVAVAGCGGSGSSGPAYAAVQLFDDDTTVSVADLAGSPALLVSWATWCHACDEELAGLQEFASSDAATDVRIVAVNLDAAAVDAQIREKVERHGLTVELWRDRRNNFRQAFGALGVPTTVLLDRDGTVLGVFPGAVDFDSHDVTTALAEARVG